MKKYIVAFILIFTCINNIIAQNKPFTVVLDPGHGGSDVGATRQGIHESHLTLKIALLVGEMLEKNHKDIKVAYTRKTDKKLEASERMSIANKANGDIFVSIHVNAAYNEAKKRDVTTAHGVEVYIQTVENTERKIRTIKNQGSIMSVNEHGQEIARRYDHLTNPAYNAIYEIKQAQVFNLSTNLAQYIGSEMGEKERNLRGVKQQSLYVTWQTVIPSVLVEVGYITNEQERKFMASAEGQKTLATGIYNGIIRYKNDFDSSKESHGGGAQVVDTEALVSTPEADTNTDTATSPIATDSEEVLFMWQVMVSSKPLKDGDARFKNLKCSYYTENNLYKYTYGSSTNYNEVMKLQGNVKKLFPDAFIIALKNGKRVNVNEVRK